MRVRTIRTNRLSYFIGFLTQMVLGYLVIPFFIMPNRRYWLTQAVLSVLLLGVGVLGCLLNNWLVPPVKVLDTRTYKKGDTFVYPMGAAATVWTVTDNPLGARYYIAVSREGAQCRFRHAHFLLD